MPLPNRSPQKISRAQESRFARMTGGRTQPGSGSVWNAKGDVDAGSFLGECKITNKHQLIMKEEVLDKIFDEPGVAYVYGPDSFPLINDKNINQEVVSLTIVSPRNGTLVVSASGFVNVSHIQGTLDNIVLNVTKDPAEQPILTHGASSFTVPSTLDPAVYREPFACRRVFTIDSAGMLTIYLVIRQFSGADVASTEVQFETDPALDWSIIRYASKKPGQWDSVRESQYQRLDNLFLPSRVSARVLHGNDEFTGEMRLRLLTERERDELKQRVERAARAGPTTPYLWLRRFLLVIVVACPLGGVTLLAITPRYVTPQ